MDFLEFVNFTFPLLKGVFIGGVGYFLTKLLIRIIKKGMSKGSLDVSLINFVEKAVKIIGYAIVAMTALSAMGISTTGIIAAFSAAGVAVALALKDSLSNIAGGIILLVAPRFVTGDYIKESEYEGTVVSVDLMHTTIRTSDNLQVAIPNGLLMNNQIVNYSREPQRRLELIFPISYESDYKKAIELAINCAKAHELSLSEPEIICRVTEYAESAVKISLRVWVETPNFHPLRFDLIENVRKAFDENGIKIPYNKLDVHIVKDEKE